MRLIIATEIFPPEVGGPATYAVALANALVKDGVSVEIVSLNPNSDNAGVTCPVYKVKDRRKLVRYWQYFRLLEQRAHFTDVIYAMGPVNAGVFAWLACRLRKKKLVVKVVGDYAWEQGVIRFGVKDMIDDFQSKNDYGFWVWLLKKVESFVVKHAEAVIVPSNYLRKMVMGWGASAEKVKMIFNSINFSEVLPIEKPVGEKWIVSVGRLVPWKGFDVLIEMMTELSQKIVSLKLKIVGDGPERKKLESQIGVLGLGSVVELSGARSRAETLRFIKAADVFVLNSAYEGLSHVLIESLLCGTPVLASRCGGNPEVVAAGENGELFEYNNDQEIRKLIVKVLSGGAVGLTDEERAVFLRQFEFDSMKERTKNVFLEICGN